MLYKREQRLNGRIKFTGLVSNQLAISATWVPRLREMLLLLNLAAAALLFFALAKPFHWSMSDQAQHNYKEGIDIVITIDVSGSMLAQDFLPNRLEASKEVAKEFIDGRKGDRIGLVAYAGEAYTACPPTLDYPILKKQIDGLNGDQLLGGTAIGVGLGTAVARLRSDSLSSKVIILLTDGVDGGADISPLMAAELAKSKNIRVYTIGVGSVGQAKTLIHSPFGSYYQMTDVEIDEVTLQKIAAKTGGEYFRATDKESLRKIYKEIEKLEKRKMEDEQHSTDPPATPLAFLNWAFLIFSLNFILAKILFKENE